MISLDTIIQHGKVNKNYLQINLVRNGESVKLLAPVVIVDLLGEESYD